MFLSRFFADFCWKGIVLFLMLKSAFQIFWRIWKVGQESIRKSNKMESNTDKKVILIAVCSKTQPKTLKNEHSDVVSC